MDNVFVNAYVGFTGDLVLPETTVAITSTAVADDHPLADGETSLEWPYGQWARTQTPGAATVVGDTGTAGENVIYMVNKGRQGEVGGDAMGKGG